MIRRLFGGLREGVDRSARAVVLLVLGVAVFVLPLILILLVVFSLIYFLAFSRDGFW